MDGEGQELIQTLKETAFKGQVSDAQMSALMIVSNQYGLNPWTKEIYAFPDKNNGIVPVVGVDGWSRIINQHGQFDGMEFEQDSESCTCIIFRKDRAHAIKVTEYLSECKRSTQPWQSHPKRMLRHKAMIQCARLAFGFVGIFDQDEAERIAEVDMGRAETVSAPEKAAVASAPDGFAEYETEHLQPLKDASRDGLVALSDLFNSMPKSTLRTAFWTIHGPALKSAAAAADAASAQKKSETIDNDTGEVIQS
ncbi:MAG: phage recombination protein Bet [Casimicrobium sp.]